MSKQFNDSSDRIKLTDDVEKRSANLKAKLEKVKEKDKYKYSGLMGRKKIEPTPIFRQAECETVYSGQNNCQIVLGRDRPGPIGTGYGGMGASSAASIDMVVGRTGREARNVGDSDVTLVAENDYKSDSARIYISERTDIDVNFGITPGRIGNAPGRSGIGIKADNIRIIAREGIKLVTRTDDTNSKGGKQMLFWGLTLSQEMMLRTCSPWLRGLTLKNC